MRYPNQNADQSSTEGKHHEMTLPFALLASGSFSECAVRTRWFDQRLHMTEELTRLISVAWTDATIEATSRGRSLYAGPMTRLLDWTAGGDTLTLDLGPTDFREFVGTNVSHPERALQSGRDALANPVGISVAVLTTDGQLVIQQRSQQVFEYPGFFHVCGGNVEPIDVAGPEPPGVLAAVRRELDEELGIGAQQTARLICLGLIENRETFKPDLLFEAEVTLAAAAYHDSSNEEYSTLVFVEGEAALTSFLIETRERLTPPGVACLLAVGRQRYGEPWYERVVSNLCAP
jgi:8-oxo-dGTP pyrophosphatase MutT (NUDIX family)